MRLFTFLVKAGDIVLIDTVRLNSRPLREDEIQMFRHLGKEKRAVSNETGELLYCFTTAEMKGSWENRILLKIQDKQWVNPSGNQAAFTVECDPYLIIELSLHKFVMGHNVFGGSNDLIGQLDYFIRSLNKWFDSKLDVSDFVVERIDYAEVFEFSAKEKISKWVEIMSKANYPRRKTLRVDEQTLYFSGTTSTLKFYHKGPEFKSHDHKRLRYLLDPEVLKRLQSQADRVLRIEVEVKKKKLKEMFEGKMPTPFELNMDMDRIQKFWDDEVKKVIRMKDKDIKKFDNVMDIQDYLKDQLGNRLGASVYLTFLNLQLSGAKNTKKQMSKPTYYRHRKLLEDHGIDWTKAASEVVAEMKLDQEVIDFRPYLTAKNRLNNDVVSMFVHDGVEPITRTDMYFNVPREMVELA